MPRSKADALRERWSAAVGRSREWEPKNVELRTKNLELRLLHLAKRDQWIEFGGSSGWDVAGEKRHKHQHDR